MKSNKATLPIARYHLEPQTGKAFVVQQGQRIRVIDSEGEQVADLTCFAHRDTDEYLSSGRTIDYNEKIYLTTGDTLYSNLSNPMLTIIDDPVGKHDFLFAPCSHEMFQLTYGITEPHPNCLDNFAHSLSPFGISASQIPTAFNIFMNTGISEDGAVTVKTPSSKAGDYLELRARMDLIIGVTACSAGKCNNFRCTAIDIEVYAARQHN
jgi:uncharacterized protein YcgI (DUF1989 family)